MHGDWLGQVDAYGARLTVGEHIQPGANHVRLATATAYGADVLSVRVDDHLGADFARGGAFDVDNGGDGNGQPFVEQRLELLVEISSHTV